jgi:ADP-L-glycero-D-manno-heptose 6-epimerase
MIVITGAAGFIGSNLLYKINQTLPSEDILIVDDLGAATKWKNLRLKKFFKIISKAKFLLDLREKKLPKSIHTIFHLGACSTTTEKNVDYLISNNTEYTLAIVNYALERDIRLIYASSAATYGDGEQGFSDDCSKLESLLPINAYGFSKHLVDLELNRLGKLASCVGLKFFNVFGPNEYHKEQMQSLIAKVFPKVKLGEGVKLFKSLNPNYLDGEQKRDFIYVDDCVEVMLWFLENSNVSGLFNVGTGRASTWNELVDALFKALKKPTKIEYIELPNELTNQYQYFTEADINKLRSVGYRAEFLNVYEALDKYVNQFLNRENQYR